MSSQAKPASTPSATTSQAGRNAMTSGGSPAEHAAIPHERIAMRAYEKWCQRGCPQGTHQQDWYEAESELRGEMTGDGRASAATTPPTAARPMPQPASTAPKPAQRR